MSRMILHLPLSRMLNSLSNKLPAQWVGRSGILLLLISLLLMPIAIRAQAGQLDASFGEEGKVVTLIKTGSEITDDDMEAIAIQPDGKIIVGGSSYQSNSSSGHSYALVRYNADGGLDQTFADNGKLTLAQFAFGNGLDDLAIQADGKLLVLGTSSSQMVLMRFTIDGEIDLTFGNGGQLPINAAGFTPRSLVLLSDGKLLIGAEVVNSNQTLFTGLGILKLNADGTPDLTFGTNGTISTDFGLPLHYGDIAVQADGKLVAVGSSADNSATFLITRYLANGLLDSTFSDDGKVMTTVGTDNAFAAAVSIQADGKIIVSGSAGNGINTDVVLVRYATDGSLDLSFDSDGIVLTDLGFREFGSGLVIQSDGRIVVVGSTDDGNFIVLRYTATGVLDVSFDNDGMATVSFYDGPISGGADDVVLQSDGRVVIGGFALGDFALARVTTTGALDTTFGDGGKVQTDVGRPIFGDASATDVVLQNANKLLVAGSVQYEIGFDVSGYEAFLARYLADGSLDSAFGEKGKIVTNINDTLDETYKNLLVLPDGKLLAVGSIFDRVDSRRRISLTRYQQNGVLDSTFGNSGSVLTDLGTNVTTFTAAATLQSDSKIIVAGFIAEADSLSDLFVIRYNSDGTLDTTFGNGGMTVIALSAENDRAIAVAIQPDGKVIVGATTALYTADLDDYLGQFAIVRLNSNGLLDTTFGTNGVVITGLPNVNLDASAMALQADGKIVLTGKAYEYDTFYPDFALARYNSDGSLDTAFGTNGIVIQDMGSSDDETPQAINLQTNGKLVVAGLITENSIYQFITTRFDTDGTLDSTFGDNGQVRTAVQAESSRAFDLIIQNNGRIVVVGDASEFVLGDVSPPYSVALVRYLGDPVNQPPTANNQTVTTNEDTATSITLTATDPDSDPLTYAVVANPQHGTLIGSAPNLTYTPAANYAGADSFTFKVNDGQADSNVATVDVTVNQVNDPPTATSQTLNTNEDTALPISLAGSDAEGSALIFTVVANPSKGTLTGSGANRTYTPNANVNGADSFTFKVNDGQIDSAVATVNITINAVNDPPTATAQSVSTNKNTAKAITLGGSDIEGNALTFTVVSNPIHGTLSGTAPNLTYTPATNYNGSDSFTFKANDGQADSTIATVTITVNAVNGPPTANDQSLTTAEDTALAVTLIGSDPDGDTLTVTIVDAPVHGALSGSGLNRSYSPAANYNGSDSFTFRLNDGTVNSNLATVIITVTPVNDAPVADNDSYETSRNTVLTVAVADGLLNGDSDLESNTLTALLVTPPLHGTVNLNPNGAFTYTPATNYSGNDSFTYKTNDGQLDSNVATVSLTVNFANSAPTATGQTVTMAEDQPVIITLTATDPDGDALAYTLTTLPTHGTVSGEAPALLYTPFANFNGSDSFAFHVNDGTVDSNTATVTLNVTAVNDAPTNLNLSNSTVQENQPAGTTIGQLTTVDVDLPDSHSYTLVSGATAAFTIVGAELRTAAAFDFEAQNSYALTIRTDDGQGGHFDKAFTISVLDVNEGSTDPTITLVLKANPQSRQNFRLTGSGGIGLVRLDDITPQDSDAYSNSKTLTVAPGSYTFSERIPSGWLLSAITCSPAANAVVALADARVTVTVVTGDNVTCTFVNDRWVSIRTLKYNDRNGNGRRNANEPYLAGWTMTVYNSAGTQVASAVTNRNGKANFNFLPWQPYTVCETQQLGWRNTEPAALNPTFNQPCYTLTLNPGQIGTVRFGNRNLPATKTLTATMAANENVTITAWPDVLDDEAGYADDVFVDEDLEQAADEERWIYLPLVAR